MYCLKHPDQKMIQLATSWVCDVCDPPKTTLSPVVTKVENKEWLSLKQLEALAAARVVAQNIPPLFDKGDFTINRKKLAVDMVDALKEFLQMLDEEG